MSEQNQQISEEAQKALERALKVLEMAQRKEGNEAEAEVAARKFQEILIKYNLDAAAIEQSRGERSGKREEQKLAGGVYKYQRRLWAWAAELHFCLYFTSQGWEDRKVRRRHWTGDMVERTVWKRVWKHRIIGRTVNVRATTALAEYLEQAIERVVMEALGDNNNQRFSRYAVSMREGMADRLCEKMAARRREVLAEEARQRHEAAEAARRAGRAGVSSETAVTLSSYAQSERDANMDHYMGEEGWSAKRAAERAASARKRAQEEAAYAEWAKQNPEEARKQAEEQERRMRKHRTRRSRSASSDDRNLDLGAYYRGRDAAEEIGLDTQVDRSRRRQIGGAK